MMKRVCNSRFAVCAMLLAVFLLVGGAVAPVCAREDMSAGQAGDPGDGLDFASGGSNGHTDGNTANSSVPVGHRTIDLLSVSIVLVPIFNGAFLHFVVLLNGSRWGATIK